MNSDRLVMTVREVAGALGISKTHAYELIAREELPALRLGRRIVVPRRALERLVNGDSEGAGPR
jgi:excisionase family DNA binding protein